MNGMNFLQLQGVTSSFGTLVSLYGRIQLLVLFLRVQKNTDAPSTVTGYCLGCRYAYLLTYAFPSFFVESLQVDS